MCKSFHHFLDVSAETIRCPVCHIQHALTARTSMSSGLLRGRTVERPRIHLIISWSEQRTSIGHIQRLDSIRTAISGLAAHAVDKQQGFQRQKGSSVKKRQNDTPCLQGQSESPGVRSYRARYRI